MELYKDASQPAERRAEDLLSRMTMEEKLGQLRMKLYGWRCYEKDDSDAFELTDEFREEVMRSAGLGGLYGLFRADPWSGANYKTGVTLRQAAALSNRVQTYVIEHSRLGIPALLAEECPHGHQGLDGVVYPVNLGAACSFNPALRGENFRHIAAEVRARGAHVGLVSTLDLLSDPRWGRSEECYGEDPYLAARMTEAIVQGMQGAHAGDVKGPDRLAIQLKHYAAQGAAVGGHNGGAVDIGECALRELHIPAMKAGARAGVLSVMASYSSVDGVLCHANKFLLTDLLRREMGFSGFVISDGNGIDAIAVQTGAADGRRSANPEALTRAAALALNAGVDMSLWGLAYDYVGEAYRQGLVAEETIDQAVKRILSVKFQLGLFENPYADEDRWAKLDRDAARKSGLDMARESIVLLKNDGLLPIDPKGKRIAVIGPNADFLYNQLGDYVAPQKEGAGHTPLAGIQRLASGAKEIRYAKGCSIRGASREGFAEAVACAKGADCAILVLGGCSTRNFDTQIDEQGAAVACDAGEMNCGEGIDVSNLALDGVQIELAKAIRETGVPMAVVLIEGRPHSVEWFAENCPALMCAWYPGLDGGIAIAEVLFGTINPSGKLAVSIPRREGQLPVYYNRYPRVPSDYCDCPDAPRYGFGYGLSYTRFELSDLKAEDNVSVQALKRGRRIEVSVMVRNAGSRGGKEVVQLYVRDLEASVLRRVRELKGFEKVWLEPGEAKRVILTLGYDELAMYNADMAYVVEPGNFLLTVSNGNLPSLTQVIHVSDDAVQVKPES